MAQGTTTKSTQIVPESIKTYDASKIRYRS